MKKLFLLASLFVVSALVSKSTVNTLSDSFQGRFDAAVSVAGKNGVLCYIGRSFLNFDGGRLFAVAHGSARLDTEIYTLAELEDLCGCCEAKFNELNELIPADERRFPEWGVDNGGELGEHIW